MGIGKMAKSVRQVVGIINKYRPSFSGITRLSLNENPFPPPENVVSAIKREGESINLYPDPEYTKLKEELANYLDVKPENISLGGGASDVLRNICDAFLDPLDKVVIPLPTYMLYAMLAMLREAHIEFLETESYNVKPEEIEKDAKIVFLCSPNNPTGNSVPRKVVEEIADDLRGILVIDEAYAEFSGNNFVDLVETGKIIVVRSFSKFFGLAGARVGYAVGEKNLISALEKVRLPFCISKASYAAAVEALRSLDYYRERAKVIARERDELQRSLEKYFSVYPSEANFILVRSDVDIARKLEEKGISVKNVTGLIGLSGIHYRITVGRPEDNRKLIQAISEIF